MNFKNIKYKNFLSEPGVIYSPYIMSNPCGEVSLSEPVKCTFGADIAKGQSVSVMTRYDVTSEALKKKNFFKLVDFRAIW